MRHLPCEPSSPSDEMTRPRTACIFLIGPWPRFTEGMARVAIDIRTTVGPPFGRATSDLPLIGSTLCGRLLADRTRDNYRSLTSLLKMRQLDRGKYRLIWTGHGAVSRWNTFLFSSLVNEEGNVGCLVRFTGDRISSGGRLINFVRN